MIRNKLMRFLRKNNFKFYTGKLEPKLQQTINYFFNQGAKFTDIREDELEMIKTPNSILKLSIPLVKDDGSYDTITGFRCHHKLHKLPAKGGIRVSPFISMNSIESLALLKCLQLALLEIPFGGAKGGLKIDIKNYSQAEIDRIIRRYTIEMSKYNFIGPGIDVPAPEFGSNSHDMDIMADTYHTLYGMNDINTTAVVTGKTSTGGGL